MTESAIMKRILSSIVAVMLTFAPIISFAQTQCPAPEQEAVIFFGNGIDTTPDSAESSLNELRLELGDTYNNHKLRYDLAYNNTSGIVIDLIQAIEQAELQWGSQILAWINGEDLAPDWFVERYAQFLSIRILPVAEELSEHVSKYERAIRSGQKVLVVSHSQGNFYVNEAKTLLATRLDPVQMQSFGIFGAAVPANNVGGEGGPYLTNHRDMILLVPTSLPQNLVLMRADGSAADDVPRLNAHFFNATYISYDFNVRPALISGIQQKIDSLKRPDPGTRNCENYRSRFVSLVAGNYQGECDGADGTRPIVISSGGQMQYPAGTVNAVDAEGFVSISQSYQANGIELITGHLTQGKFLDSAVGNWDQSKKFSHGGYSDSLASVYQSCFARNTREPVPETFIPRPVDIAKDVAQLLDGYRTILPTGACQQFVNGVASVPSSPEISFSGTTLDINGSKLDLNAPKDFASAWVPPGAEADSGKADYEPQFHFNAYFLDGSHLQFKFKAVQGITLLVLTNASNTLASCSFRN